MVDPSRARTAGWSPRWSFSEGIQAVWDEWSKADVEGAVSVPGGSR